jgi:hypothetical protein
MTLYDLFMSTLYGQKFHVYDENSYDQHVHHGSGTRAELLDEQVCETGVDVLCNKVISVRSCRDGALLVVVKADHYNRRVEKLYSKDYVAEWNRYDKSTRPWLFSSEMLKECDAF